MPEAVTRRLVLTGVFGAGVAAVLAKLPDAPRPPAAAPAPAPAPVPRRVAPRAAARPPTTAEPDSRVPDSRVFDLVVAGGRVIDPDTGFDGPADVGVSDGRIAAVGPGLRGRRTLEAAGRVVAPGFIDLLSYDPNDYGVWYKVADGVTSNLGMHGLNSEPRAWFGRFAEERPPVHYGGAFDHAWARAGLGIDPYRPASAAQVDRLRGLAADGLAGGWAGVHLELEYTPGAEPAEVMAMAEVAAAADGVGLYVHGRYSDASPPGTNADTLDEVLGLARATGVPVHVEHLTSTGGTFTMDQSLATIDAARAEGLDVTACMYPYDYWATYLGSARFAEGWQERFRITYDDLVVAGTGERLTARTFARQRAANTLVAAMAIPEEDVRAGLRSDLVMIGSDAILEPGDNNHPRAAGCFSRVLGRYARDEEVLSLGAALAKMTVMPARRLEGALPAMARKGRLQVGCDADITVFDPATVGDQATLEDPSRESTGIDWVVVGGQVVKTPEGLQRDVRPGQPLARG